MDKTIKDNWLIALRSNKYTQGKYSLRKCENDVDKYCCLGVLYDLHTNGLQWKKTPSPLSTITYEIDGCTGSLSYDFKHQVGIIAMQQQKLIDMNDAGRTFAEIADHIDKYL